MKKISKKERYELVGFDDQLLRWISIPILSFLFTVFVLGVGPADDTLVFWESYITTLIHIIIYWEFDRYLVLQLRRKYYRIQDYKKRITIQTILIVLSTVVFSFLSILLQMIFSSYITEITISFLTFVLTSVLITILIVTIYEAVYSFIQWKENLVKNEKLQKENTRAQLEVLKNQVNPHFLFNSINTLISVIPEDPEIAVEFAENLSSVYRYVLQIRDKELIELQEEMESIEAYKYLLKIRFGDQLIFHIEDSGDMSGKYIVPLSVQMLIENCIKHNIISKSKSLEIKIQFKDDYLIVINSIQPKMRVEESTKIGLRNIQKRYELLVQKSIDIIRNDEFFEVHLPIIKIEEVK